MSLEVPKLGRALLAMRNESNCKCREWGGIWGEMCRGRGPERFGKPTIFRPRYSQPGRTDSRKAFLWAPPENKEWPLSRGEGKGLRAAGLLGRKQCLTQVRGLLCICSFLV